MTLISTNAGNSEWKVPIQSWFDEYKKYTFGTDTYNHYTQVRHFIYTQIK